MAGSRVTTDEIQLDTDDLPACGGCGGETLLLARFPHSWKNNAGEDVEGLGEATLCPGCDRGEPAADELLALFVVDERLDHGNVETFSRLAARWVDVVRTRTVDADALAEEEARWHSDAL